MIWNWIIKRESKNFTKNCKKTNKNGWKNKKKEDNKEDKMLIDLDLQIILAGVVGN